MARRILQTSVMVAALAAAALACQPRRGPTYPGTGPGAAAHGSEDRVAGSACPMNVPNTTVAVTDRDDGVALTFVTLSQRVDELRDRVTIVADMHEERWQDGGDIQRVAGREQHRHGRRSATIEVPVETEVEEVDHGATMMLRPRDEAQMSELRQQARAYAQELQAGRCPLMEKVAG